MHFCIAVYGTAKTKAIEELKTSAIDASMEYD